MRPDFFDIHSHIQLPEFDSDRDAVIQRLREQNTWTITVGTDKESSKKAVESTQLFSGIFAAIGQHPTDDSEAIFDESFYSQLATDPKTVAIGECGLDYFRAKDDSREEKKRQKEIFESHIELSLTHNKPLMVHCRDAYEDVLDILELRHKEAGGNLKGNVHFFAGNVDIARRFLSIGFTCSFTGVITFTPDYDEVISYIPLESILSETDSPFVAPVPFRGKRCEPSFVSYVVERISQIKNISLDEAKKAMVDNAFRVFPLSSLH
ncbi:MAG: TatD family hydrolase [Patescibacteria group bacterium]|nr:TatD family hydrolase [bacterium]MDZ4241027.1 TatD family hydrolase [Patescibacteria group bacterium]